MTRLKRVSCSGPGIARVRSGKRFRYVDAAGAAVTDEAVLARIEALVLPPAWEHVWICTLASGHIQATGVDARGRRQYRYHDAWRVQRDLAKHDRVLEFAAALPAARERLREQLAGDDLGRERVLACAVRLIDLAFFRIGGEQYATSNESFGLATLRKDHVSVKDDALVFEFTGKSGKDWHRSVAEPEVLSVVRSLKRRRGGGPELLAYRDGDRWVDVKSGDINAHLREVVGLEATAKDFRTWAATVLAAAGLGVSNGVESPSGRKRAVAHVVREVADYLGNTPAVCRASYIDPRLFDLYDNGVAIDPAHEALGDVGVFGEPGVQGAFEAKVLSLLRTAPAALREAG